MIIVVLTVPPLMIFVKSWFPSWTADPASLGLIWGSLVVVGAALALSMQIYRATLFHGRKALVAARDQALAASRAKTRFLTNLSHELRTPMYGVLGLLELTLEGELGPNEKQNLEVAHQSASSLRALLDDLLDLSRIEQGMLTLSPEPTQIRKLLHQALAPNVLQAEKQGLRLVWSVDDSVPDCVIVDPARLQQIIVNLVANAIKFTPEGSVVVSARFDSLGGSTLQIEVADSGMGISPGEQEAIFERFIQLDGSMSRIAQGLGVGLAIASQLVTLMEGQLSVDSAPGQGSTFKLVLPVSIGRRSAEAADDSAFDQANSAPDTMPVLSILVADDNPINLRITAQMLRRSGHEVTTADTGKTALAAFEKHDFDLVLMDIQMPEMDGHATTRIIRCERGAKGKETAIIGLTAHASDDERIRCLDAGMDGFLAKPVSRKSLLDAVVHTVRRKKTHS